MILVLVTRPFSSAVGLSKPFRPPGFVERSTTKEISNQSDNGQIPSENQKDLNSEPMFLPSASLLDTPDGDVHPHEEGKWKLHLEDGFQLTRVKRFAR